jgi:hypothetical protein
MWSALDRPIVVRGWHWFQSQPFRSMQSPVKEQISLREVTRNHSRHRFRLFNVDRPGWRSRKPFMRQASCCCCSSGSCISGIISCAEQWRRKFRVESSHALSRYGISILGWPSGEKDTPAITWYHCLLIWRRLWKGPGVRRCLMMRSVCTIPCSKKRCRHPRPPYQTDRNTIERGVFLL